MNETEFWNYAAQIDNEGRREARSYNHDYDEGRRPSRAELAAEEAGR